VLGVCSLVLEHGGSEDEAIGALLHDAAEDQGGEAQLAAIRDRFGDAVADIVSGCTDTVVTPKPPWRQRKEDYIAHLPSASAAVLLVSLADKLYNARAILSDYRQLGEALWVRFQGGRDGTLWYYRTLSSAYQSLRPGALADELARVVDELEQLAHRE
jgi:GTP pyrophosphokinase